MGEFVIAFAADRMLGRLARMLRLLGYDTLYSPQTTSSELLDVARSGHRLILTRGNAQKRFPGVTEILSLRSEFPAHQFREVVERFQLDTHVGLWTRCTLCNAPIEKAPKPAIEPQVDPKVFRLYEEFYRCTGCGHIYWRGSHVERIVKNLSRILEQPPK